MHQLSKVEYEIDNGDKLLTVLKVQTKLMKMKNTHFCVWSEHNVSNGLAYHKVLLQWMHLQHQWYQQVLMVVFSPLFQYITSRLLSLSPLLSVLSLTGRLKGLFYFSEAYLYFWSFALKRYSSRHNRNWMMKFVFTAQRQQ